MSKALQSRLEVLKSERSKALNTQASMVIANKTEDPAFRAIQSNIDSLTSDIETINQLLSMPSYQAMQEKQEQEAQERAHQQMTGAVVTAVKAAIPAPVVVTASKVEDRSKVAAAYRSLLKNGFNPVGHVEQRDVLQSTAAGVSLVAEQFRPSYIEALRSVSPLASLVTSMEDSRETRHHWIDDSSNNQVLLAEGSSAPASNNVTPLTASWTPNWTDTAVSVTRASWQFINDVGFTFDGFIRKIVQGRIGRFYDAAVLKGTDVAGNALPNSVAGGLLGAVTNGVTASGTLAAGPAYSDFVALVNAVSDPVYADPQNGSAFIVSPALRAKILANVKDTAGRPIYKFVEGQLFLLGAPIYVSPQFAAYGASTVQALFGKFDVAFSYNYFNTIRTVTPLPELMESEVIIANRYAGTPTSLAANAVVKLTTAAS
jgi:HK97 family phage major capsid protein